LSQLKVQILLPPQGILLFPPCWRTGRSHSLDWLYNCWSSKNCSSCKNKAKISPLVLHQKQYPLKPEGWWSILPIINSLKHQELLVECSSTYSTPILAVWFMCETRTTFCLHRGQTHVMGPHWNSCYTCYPSVPSRYSVLALVPLPPCIMILLSPLVTAILFFFHCLFFIFFFYSYVHTMFGSQPYFLITQFQPL
jgi:hypothetical protein